MTIDTITEIKTKSKTKFPNMWRVILHNDNYTPMEFVVAVLMQIFHKPFPEAHTIMLLVHTKGKAQVGLFTKEIATQKVSEVGNVAEASGHPLLATIEET